MKKEVMELWVEALESGNYPQALGMLNNSVGGFCCLGVLCDVAAQHGEHVNDTQTEAGSRIKGGNLAVAQPIVARWAGLTVSGGDRLIALNDTKGKTFAQIAKYIRRNWKVL